MTNCPAIDDLARLALGTLPDAAAEPIEEHLLACPDCVRRLADLRLDDTLLDGLRLRPSIANADPSELNAELRGLLAPRAERPTPASEIETTVAHVDRTSHVASDARDGGSPASGGQRSAFSARMPRAAWARCRWRWMKPCSSRWRLSVIVCRPKLSGSSLAEVGRRRAGFTG
ncbi:MAG TPA: hypothetical protein VGX76_02605 [Pirellulales bacterium]|nr:hypothetical protein [Pirellulales bacterium]